MLDKLNPLAWVATLFFIGKIPHLGSVIASILAVPIAIFILLVGGKTLLLIASVALFFLGLFSTAIYLKKGGVEQEIVVDEVVAMWVVLLLCQFFGYEMIFVVYSLALACFVIFDIWKPWPSDVIHDRFHGSLGIMLDDLIIAFYAFAGMAVSFFFYTKLGWGG